MALEQVFQALYTDVEQLNGALLGLRLTIIEDKPLHDEAAVADALGDAAEDLIGWGQEALAAAAHGRNAAGQAGGSLDLEKVTRSLSTCHDLHNRIGQRLNHDLRSYEHISELARVGRERRGEWLAWSKSVRQSVDRCTVPYYTLGQTIVICWREIGERIGMNSLSVHATNIGQQITVPEARDAVRGGLP